MLPMKSLRLSLGTALATAAPLKQATNANVIRLIAAPFTPSEDLVVGDLTFATFTGSTGLDAELGDQDSGVDPLSGEQRVTIVEPVGGWRWETADAVNLPETIYGFALLTNASAALLAVQAFPSPIALTEAGQEINIGKADLTIVLSPMS
jgi:hypothetical protein